MAGRLTAGAQVCVVGDPVPGPSSHSFITSALALIPWVHLDSADVPGEHDQLRLMQRGQEFSIRVGSSESLGKPPNESARPRVGMRPTMKARRLVGAGEEGRWDGKAEGSRRLKINGQLKPFGLLDGKIGGLHARQYLVHVGCRTGVHLPEVRPVPGRSGSSIVSC